MHSCTFRGPLFLPASPGSLVNAKHSGKEECKKKKKMSLHKVQIKFCCVASFLFLPPPLPSDVFITKPNVCLESAKSSQERENPLSKMLKSHLRIRFLLPSVHPGSGAYEPHVPSVRPAFYSCWQCAVFTVDC